MIAQYNFKRALYRLNRSRDKIQELQTILRPLQSPVISKLLTDAELGIVEVRTAIYGKGKGKTGRMRKE